MSPARKGEDPDPQKKGPADGTAGAKGAAGRKRTRKKAEPEGKPRMLGTPVKRLISRKRDLQDLAGLGIHTVDDAFRYFPRTYIHPGRLTNLADLQPGENVVVQATFVSLENRPMKTRKGWITTLTLSDGMSDIEVTFFNQPWLEQQLRPGQPLVLTGQVTEFRGRPQLTSPQWLNRNEKNEYTEEELTKPIPVYRASKRINSFRVWRLISTLLDLAVHDLEYDPLPEEIRTRFALPTYREALERVHRPQDSAEPESTEERWKIEEAFALQAELISRKKRHVQKKAQRLRGLDDGVLAAFDADLPYALTGSQKKAGEEIAADLLKRTPMNRLLHGDVGSGKTLVALRAMLQAVDSGVQAAFLAPTEVLAVQHLRSLEAQLGARAVGPTPVPEPGTVRLGLLTGSMSTKDRKRVLLDLQTGQIDIVVGTHALLSETTGFLALGLVVVDEQHRFGVRQREALRAKGEVLTPHMLVMTATPIPRTVAMTVFGDLDVTTLTDMPGGGKDIRTHAFSYRSHPTWMDRVVQVLGEAVDRGEQCFVVASRIDTQEFVEATEETPEVPHLAGLEELAWTLRRGPLADARFEILHGRMDAEEKDRIMRAFRDREFDVLVATTVIEVGIDVPNAKTILVYDADRFGVAQLHQLRGRVGRDGSPATCFLVTGQFSGSESMERLEKVASTLDGFVLAEYDLETRREGDVLGRAQWGGASSLKYLSVMHDQHIIESARAAAQEWVELDPDISAYPPLRDYISTLLVDEDEDWIEAS
ncbi:ATP-dependent DNA helicase RecG [Brevibacterium samyangense]|uniref:ATP-dependent DNA helicase RecG n=1 Tax=Brevibacterium samyangense TaxID=366888 RepID=A0ABP5EFW5_9MICO